MECISRKFLNPCLIKCVAQVDPISELSSVEVTPHMRQTSKSTPFTEISRCLVGLEQVIQVLLTLQNLREASYQPRALWVIVILVQQDLLNLARILTRTEKFRLARSMKSLFRDLSSFQHYSWYLHSYINNACTRTMFYLFYCALCIALL